MTATIGSHTLGPIVPQPRSMDEPLAPHGNIAPAGTGVSVLREVSPQRDLMSLYAKRLSGANWQQPRVADAPIPAPIPFGRAVWQAASATKERDNCEQNSSDVDQIPATRFRIASHRSDETKDADQPSKSADEADDQMHSGVPRRNHRSPVYHQGWE